MNQPFGFATGRSASWQAARFTSFIPCSLFLLLCCMRAVALEPWTAPESSAALKSPLPPQPEIIARGRSLYMDRCVDCHGKKGKGDGPGAADLERRPPDLTHQKISDQPEGALFWKITEGRKPMPAYGKKLTEEQRWQVVQFIRTFAAPAGNKNNKKQTP
jgi:mono/diheme cytochrome c family protein